MGRPHFFGLIFPALVTRPCAGRRPATSESRGSVLFSAPLRLCGGNLWT